MISLEVLFVVVLLVSCLVVLQRYKKVTDIEINVLDKFEKFYRILNLILGLWETQWNIIETDELNMECFETTFCLVFGDTPVEH